VGHPLLDIVKPSIERADFLRQLGLAQDKTTIALLPGSRKQEINNILPVMLETSRLIRKEIDAQFVIARSPSVSEEIYNRMIRRSGLDVKTAEGKTHDCLNIADFALVCSGTATLETAIMQKPFCVIYKMGLLNYLLYRPQVKLPYIGMVNIVAGRKIIPEFIQFNASPKKIAQEALSILRDKNRLQEISRDLGSVRSSLGPSGAASRAAQIILNTLKN
jgi:lipid-A-disaccharide synthase